MKALWIGLALLAACGDDGGATRIDAPGEPMPDALPAALSHTLYLAFDGGMITPGTEDASTNTSSIAIMAATLPPYLQGDAQRATKLAAIVSQLQLILSAYNIDIVTARPAAAPYDMIVFTSAMASAIGSTSAGSALTPTACNEFSSVIGFAFGRGGEIPRDIAVRNAIAMFGLAGGIPLTTTANDCMCLIGTSCANLPAPCNIGATGTMVTTGAGSCGFTGAIGEASLFEARYGHR